MPSQPVPSLWELDGWRDARLAVRTMTKGRLEAFTDGVIRRLR